MIAATVLAAGDSTRMGSPKALLEYRGRTFLASVADTLGRAGITRSVVVIGSELLKKLSPNDLGSVTVVTNPEPERGPIGSVRAAIGHLERETIDGLIIWPVDLPHVRVETINRLIAAVDEEADIVVPRLSEGRRGHPLIVTSRIFQEIMLLAPGQTLRDVVRADRSRVKEVEVTDPAILDSINTPRDYQRLLGG